MTDLILGIPDQVRQFVGAVLDPDAPMLRNALLMGVLSSVAFGINGAYVVTRRIASIAGAISHSVLGGIGIAIWLERSAGIEWLTPTQGALAASLVSALAIGLVSLYAREREDTVIGAIWAMGMAVGVIFLSKSPGAVDAMSYLFGSILLISERDLWLVLLLDLVVAGIGVAFYHKLLAVCFNEELARVRGVWAEGYYLLLLGLTALTVVMMVRVVGVVMVIAMLTIPAAVAGAFARRLWSMMAGAVVLCAFFTAGGLFLSYGPDLPSGPTIIVFAGGCYFLVLVGQKARRTWRSRQSRPARG